MNESTINTDRATEDKAIFDSELKAAYRQTDDNILTTTDSLQYENFDNVQQRKEQRVQSIQKWEIKRVQTSKIYTNIIEKLNSHITKVAQDSSWGFNQIVQFIKSRVQADQKYASQKQTQISDLYSLQNGKTLNYASVYLGTKEFSQYQADHLLEIQKQAITFERESLSALLKVQREFEQRLSDYNLLCHSLSKRYQTTFEQSLARYKLYIQIYQETVKTYTRATNQNEEVKDLAIAEFEYLIQVDQHYTSLKTFGKESLAFFKEFKEAEVQRIQSIKKIFQAYQQYLRDRLVIEPENAIAGWDFEDIDPAQEIEGQLDILGLLDEGDKDFIRLIYEVPTLTLDIFNQYIVDFKLPQVKDQPLIVKEIKAQKRLGNHDSWIDCTIIITIDKNVYVVEGHDSYHRNPMLKFKIFKGCCAVDEQKLILYEQRQQFFCLVTKRIQHQFRTEEINKLQELYALIN